MGINTQFKQAAAATASGISIIWLPKKIIRTYLKKINTYSDIKMANIFSLIKRGKTMGLNTRFKQAADANASGVFIQWGSNKPTPAVSQTIVNGSAPTGVEIGQHIANIEHQISLILGDIASLRAAIND